MSNVTYTLNERIEMVKIFYRKGNCRLAIDEFSKNHPERPRPTVTTMLENVRKLESTGQLEQNQGKRKRENDNEDYYNNKIEDSLLDNNTDNKESYDSLNDDGNLDEHVEDSPDYKNKSQDIVTVKEEPISFDEQNKEGSGGAEQETLSLDQILMQDTHNMKKKLKKKLPEIKSREIAGNAEKQRESSQDNKTDNFKKGNSTLSLKVKSLETTNAKETVADTTMVNTLKSTPQNTIRKPPHISVMKNLDLRLMSNVPQFTNDFVQKRRISTPKASVVSSEKVDGNQIFDIHGKCKERNSIFFKQIQILKMNIEKLKQNLLLKDKDIISMKALMKRREIEMKESKEKLIFQLVKKSNELKELRQLNMEHQKCTLNNYRQLQAAMQQMNNVVGAEGSLPLPGYCREDNNMIHLGQGEWLPKQTYALVVSGSLSPATFAANMAVAVFGNDVLRNSTISGEGSNRNKRQRKPQHKLDPVKILAIRDIFRYWMESKMNMSPEEIADHIDKTKKYIGRKISQLKKDRKITAMTVETAMTMDHHNVTEEYDQDSLKMNKSESNDVCVEDDSSFAANNIDEEQDTLKDEYGEDFFEYSYEHDVDADHNYVQGVSSTVEDSSQLVMESAVEEEQHILKSEYEDDFIEYALENDIDIDHDGVERNESMGTGQ